MNVLELKTIQKDYVLPKKVHQNFEYFSNYRCLKSTILYRKGRNDVINSLIHQRNRQNLGDNNMRCIGCFGVILLWIVLNFSIPTTYQKLSFWPYFPFKRKMCCLGHMKLTCIAVSGSDGSSVLCSLQSIAVSCSKTLKDSYFGLQHECCKILVSCLLS